MLLYKGTTFRAPSYDFRFSCGAPYKGIFSRGSGGNSNRSIWAHEVIPCGSECPPKIGTADLQWKPESWNGTIPMPLGKAAGILALILRNPCSNFLGFAVDVVEHNEILKYFEHLWPWGYGILQQQRSPWLHRAPEPD